MRIDQRIAALRIAMHTKKLDALIIPSTDPHMSEYVCAHWKLREYFSGFDGSAGTLVITKDKAALWTDSRYFLQVAQQCADTEVQLHQQSIPHAPEHIPWLKDILNKQASVGADFQQLSKAQLDAIQEVFADKLQLVHAADIWETAWPDRPALPNTQIAVQPIEFAGKRVQDKCALVQNRLQEKQADYYLVSSLDEIAWLYNLRAQDIDFTPLAISYALVGKEKSYLFAEPNRFDKALQAQLHQAQIAVLPYSECYQHLEALASDQKILTDATSLNAHLYQAIAEQLQFEDSIIKTQKAIKNEVEIAQAKDCMRKDGIALTHFLMWLETALETQSYSEYELGKKLESFRKQQADYTGESFAAIVGYKGNGAIIHYRAPKEGSAMVSKEGILLIDSGAQYQNGTTDITRTLWLGGQATTALQHAYTGVLQGYIALETAQFPVGTTGIQLDAFARMPLWQLGFSYPHGTGHGIGSYGMVHEDAQGFATSMTTCRGGAPHLPNQLTTIEPGCYKAGEFGIRTENVVLSLAKESNDFGNFMGFQPITLCPIDTQLLVKDLLSQKEIDWLNNYHQMVYDTLAPELDGIAQQWLAEKCKAF